MTLTTHSATSVETTAVVLRSIDQMNDDLADLVSKGWRFNAVQPISTREDGLSVFNFVRDAAPGSAQ